MKPAFDAMVRSLVSLLFCLVPLTAHAFSEDEFSGAQPVTNFNPALIYLSGSKDSDKAFIEMARTGARRAEKELGISFKEFRLPENENETAFMERVAQTGASPIIALGHQNVVPVLNLAEKYPKTQFTVIDGLVPPLFPNVQSIIYKDHEGAFLIGMIAAHKSASNQIGFIGGKDVPLIRNFALGFKQGAQFEAPNIRIQINMVGQSDEAWSDPATAYDMAKRMYDDGVDVIFAAAGGSGLGVLRAAADFDKYAIGVDTNQNGLYPGHVLTSLVKRVDNAVYDTLENAQQGYWRAGIKYLGLKENALDFSVDQHNKDLIDKELIDKAATAKERIINGIVDVEMYSPN